MTIVATCATLAALIAANPGATISLPKQTCVDLRIAAKPAKRVTINAGGSTIRLLRITGGNIRWRGGTIQAIETPFTTGPAGYGVWLNGATNVRLDGVLVTAARKGIVVAGGSDITIADSRFWRVGEDGIIAAGVRGFIVTRNSFSETIGKPTECAVAGVVTTGVAKRDCAGTWTDGTHGDAIQMRDGVADARLEGNAISGGTQGITQMDSPGDAPLERVRALRNTIRTDRQHKLTMYACIKCEVSFNTVGRAPGSASRPVIIAPTSTLVSNTVEP